MEWILPEYMIRKGKFYCRRPHFFRPGRLLPYIFLYETSMSPKGNLKKLRARKGSSHINESVWWLWIWAEVVASRPQTLLSLVKGDLGMQKFCQLDHMGSFLTESFRKAVLGVTGVAKSQPRDVGGPPGTYLLYLTGKPVALGCQGLQW